MKVLTLFYSSNDCSSFEENHLYTLHAFYFCDGPTLMFALSNACSNTSITWILCSNFWAAKSLFFCLMIWAILKKSFSTLRISKSFLTSTKTEFKSFTFSLCIMKMSSKHINHLSLFRYIEICQPYIVIL